MLRSFKEKLNHKNYRSPSLASTSIITMHSNNHHSQLYANTQIISHLKRGKRTTDGKFSKQHRHDDGMGQALEHSCDSDIVLSCKRCDPREHNNIYPYDIINQ